MNIYSVSNSILFSLSQLSDPNPNFPANSMAAHPSRQLFKENRREYDKRVMAYTAWLSVCVLNQHLLQGFFYTRIRKDFNYPVCKDLKRDTGCRRSEKFTLMKKCNG